MVNNAVDIKFLLLRPTSMVNFRATEHGQERVTCIDRREFDGEYKVCKLVRDGAYIERTGYFPKLIPWHLIDDIDLVGDSASLLPQLLGRDSGNCEASPGRAVAPTGGLTATNVGPVGASNTVVKK